MSSRARDLQRRLQRAVGARIKHARKQAGLRQDTLGAALDLSRTSISNIERGTQRIFVDQIYAAAHALRIEVNELLPPVSDIAPKGVTITGTADLSPTVAASLEEIAEEVPQVLKRQHTNRRSREMKGNHD